MNRPKYAPCGAPVVWKTAPGPRLAWTNSSSTSSVTPTSSRVTPIELIRAITLIPTALIVVVRTTRIVPRITAFVAMSLADGDALEPTSWKPDQIVGSTTCRAIAAAAIVTIWATSIVQPANQPIVALESRRDHW